MALLLKGNELIATEALGAEELARLVNLATRRPLKINGVELRSEDLELLIEEARRSGHGVLPGTQEGPSSINGDSVLLFEDTSLPELKYREKVLAHATLKFANLRVSSTAPDEIIRLLKSFLKIENARLQTAHRFGAPGSRTARARSFVLDLLLRHIFRSASGTRVENQSACDVVALGEYGRSELAPFPDIDLLFLQAGSRSRAMEERELIERILHLLWDAGLHVRHYCYTTAECLQAAHTDIHLRTALVTARLVAGSGDKLFLKLNERLEQRRLKDPTALIAAARRERDERLEKVGYEVCLEEPHVEESAGGLRDLHAALCVTTARYGCETLGALFSQGIITKDERRRVAEAYDFLLRVRHEAHWTTNRKTDRLTLDLQQQLALRLGYSPLPHRKVSEQFMRDYYRRATEINLFSERMFALATAREDDSSARRKPHSRRAAPAEPFSIRDGQLYSETGSHSLIAEPLLFFEAVQFAQIAGVTFGQDLCDSFRNSLSAVDRDLRFSPKAASAFLSVLRRRGRVGHGLRLMRDTGFLGRYMPEFGRIRFLVQHDLNHHCTIDEHTLRAIEAIDELNSRPGKSSAYLRAALDDIEDSPLLYLSLLLHDLGKGFGSGHSERGSVLAMRICERLHLDRESATIVANLVRDHLLMVHISQRRDLSEPRVIEHFAESVGNLESLNMLLLLTYADLTSVAPHVWSDWKGKQLQELYERTREQIMQARGVDGNTPGANEKILQLKERVKLSVIGEISPQEVEHHFSQLPERYARTTDTKRAVAHLRLITRLRKGEALTCQWSCETTAATELIICARDRKGLFADIAGALAARGIEILSADLNTRRDHIAIDQLVLRETATQQSVVESRRNVVEGALERAVTGTMDVAAEVERWRTCNAPRRSRSLRSTASVKSKALPEGAQIVLSLSVVFDNDAAESTTVMEVRAVDEPGLAYKISAAISGCGLNIVCAKIATEKSDAFDVFYITDAAGGKLSETEMHALKAALSRALCV